MPQAHRPAIHAPTQASACLLIALLSGCSLLPKPPAPPSQPALLGAKDDGALTWHYPGQGLGVVVSDRKAESAPPAASAMREITPTPRPARATATAVPATPAAPALVEAPPPGSTAKVSLAPPPAPAFDAAWWICLSSWQQPRAAFAARQRAKASGLAPIIRRQKSGTEPGSPPLYRVLIGPYTSRDSAQHRREREDIRRVAPDAWLLTPAPIQPPLLQASGTNFSARPLLQ